MQTEQYLSEPHALTPAVNAAAETAGVTLDLDLSAVLSLFSFASSQNQAPPPFANLAKTNDSCHDCFLKAEYCKAVCERAYWQKMHQKAVEREGKLKETVAELQAKLKLREKQLFGKKSESNKTYEKAVQDSDVHRNRGQQPGSVGHGRRSHQHLPAVEEIIDLPEEKRVCEHCRLPLSPFPGTEDSEEIEIDVNAYRRVIRRKRYKRTCKCDHLPLLVTAPPVAKLIPKGSFAISIWVMVLLNKYLYQHPTHRLIAQLKSHALHLCAGTITGGLQRLAPLFEPVAQAILEKNRKEQLWHADETRWLVFATTENKIGHLWYMWVFLSASTVVFTLDPSRSSEVPRRHFGDVREGFLIVDRYSAYKKFVKATRIIICFCWSHQRRDFLDAANQWPRIESWAMGWVEQIGTLYHLNDLRLARESNSDAYASADAALRVAVETMARRIDDELAQSNPHPAALKVLQSMKNHWRGLTVFLDYPQVPMDNNRAERAERGPAVGRKNYYGSGSLWSGKLCATLFTVFQTLLLWNLNPRLWLTAFLWACAQNGGHAPDDISCWLPWNMSEQQRNALSIIPEVKSSS